MILKTFDKFYTQPFSFVPWRSNTRVMCPFRLPALVVHVPLGHVVLVLDVPLSYSETHALKTKA